MIRQTSVEAYNTIRDNGLLSKRRWEVYQILFKYGPLTAHQVVEKARTKYPLSNQTSFNARLSELEKTGCVLIAGEAENKVSGMKNKLWDVTNRLPIKLDKPKRIKCKSCDGKGYIESKQIKMF